jgi:hypothetical protein
MPIPISALTAIGQVGAGAINYFEGRKQKKAGAELYSQQLEDIRSGKFDFTLDKSQTDAANLTRQYGETLARQAGERGQSLTTSSIMAARGGDPRAAAGLGTQMAASDQAIRDAQTSGFETSIGAQSNLADLEQNLLTANEQTRLGVEQGEMQRGGAAAEAGRQQQFQGISQFLQSPVTGASVEQQMPGATFGFGQGFNVPSAEDGMKTPGPFSHERNPIHMIDKDGDKVGEATGGELIFNPDQTSDIESLIDNGQAYRLMMYMRDLLSQPQFQEEEDNYGKGGKYSAGGFVFSDKSSVDYDVSDLTNKEGGGESSSGGGEKKEKIKSKKSDRYNRKRFARKFKRRQDRYNRRNEKKLEKGYKEFLRGQKRDDREIARQENQEQRQYTRDERMADRQFAQNERAGRRADRQVNKAERYLPAYEEIQRRMLERGGGVGPLGTDRRRFNRIGNKISDLNQIIGSNG